MTEPEIDKEDEETSPVDEEEPENVAAEAAGDEDAEAANDEDAEAAEEEPGEDGAPEEDAEAEEAFRHATDIDPQHALVWRDLGLTLLRQAKHSEAEEGQQQIEAEEAAFSVEIVSGEDGNDEQ